MLAIGVADDGFTPTKARDNEEARALLRWGRRLLRSWSKSRRIRHLYPQGPNLALLFHAYQSTLLQRDIRFSDRPQKTRWLRKTFKRRLKDAFRRDIRSRNDRLNWKLPPPEPTPLDSELPGPVMAALASIPDDKQALVRGHITARHEASAPSLKLGQFARASERQRLQEGLIAFGPALQNELFDQPDALRRIHPQYLLFTESPYATRQSHPIASFIFIRLPLHLLLWFSAIFSIAYYFTYKNFNDERLAQFLTEQIGSIVDGELAFEKVHWGPTLIVDLVIGRAHRVEIDGAHVYEGFKYHRKDESAPIERRETAYAEHLSADLVLHEIIPWNRMGVPRVFDIPWVLHFRNVRSEGEMWVGAREYYDQAADALRISLTDAFGPSDDSPPSYGYKRLSFRVDQTQFKQLTVPLDFLEHSEWGVSLKLKDANLQLFYRGDYPEAPEPAELPFTYRLQAAGGIGNAVLLDENFSLSDIDSFSVGAGIPGYPQGDLSIELNTQIEGAACTLTGGLLRVFHDNVGVRTQLRCTNPRGMLHKVSPPDPATGRALLDASAPSRIQLRINGSLDNPAIDIAGDQLTIDSLLEPGWIIQNANIAARLVQRPLDDHWEQELGAVRQQTEHWILQLEHLQGNWIGGELELTPQARPQELILANPGEPYLARADIELRGINPAKLAVDAPDVAPYLSGSGDGKLHIQRVSFGDALTETPPLDLNVPAYQKFAELWPTHEPFVIPPKAQSTPEPEQDLRRLVLEIPEFQLTTRSGSATSNLPSNISFTGRVEWDEREGLAIPAGEMRSDGARLAIDLRMPPSLESIRSSMFVLDIDDGKRFFGSLGLPALTRKLSADLSVSGPLHDLSGPEGRLSSPGLVIGELEVDGLERAKLRVRHSVLSLSTAEASFLGGRGPLVAELWFPRSGRRPTPWQVRGSLDLNDLAQTSLLGLPIAFDDANVQLVVDDGAGGPLPLEELRARGHAYIPTLEMAGISYDKAQASFILSERGIELDDLSLFYGRRLSPQLYPDLRVQTGFFSLRGLIGLENDPTLDLEVQSEGLPLRALTNFGGMDIPVRGRLGRGSQLRIQGSVSQPVVEGQIHLASVNAANLSLGHGELQFTSNERTQGTGANAISVREVNVKGRLDEPGRQRSGLAIDATLAVGRDRSGKGHFEVSGQTRFTLIPLRRLLALPHQGKWEREITGNLRGLGVRASYCPSRHTMLDICAQRLETTPAQNDADLQNEALALDVELERAWAGTRLAIEQDREDGSVKNDPNCPRGAQICTLNTLNARLDGNRLALKNPWKLSTGLRGDRAQLEISGDFDLRDPDQNHERRSCQDFERRAMSADTRVRPTGLQTRGRIAGAIELMGLDPLILPLERGLVDGRLDVAIDLFGPISQPWVEGSVRADVNGGPMTWTASHVEQDIGTPLRISVPAFAVDLAGDVARLESDIDFLQGRISVGDHRGNVTALGLSRGCQGQYEITVRPGSILDTQVFSTLFPDDIQSSHGAMGIDRFTVRGSLNDAEMRAAPPLFDRFDARFSFQHHATRLSIADMDLRLVSGIVDLHMCSPTQRCRSAQSGIGVFVGGEAATRGDRRPEQALGVESDGSGNINYIWGQLYIAPELDELRSAELGISLRQFPYRQDDNAGRPELTASLSSERLRLILQPGGYRQLSGTLSAEHSRWLRDATQGVRSVVSFADPVPAPPSTLPESLAQLELDLDLRTTGPFRVDNNILRGLEAQAQLHLGGTLDSIEVTGQIDVQRGVLDLALLGGAYDIDRGRVRLDRRIADSEVELLATRQAPVRIDNELHQVTLQLSGALDAIQWRCRSTAQRNDGLQTLRGCIDYLIFDAGNAALAPDDTVNQAPLALTRRSLTLFGNLTQVELNQYVEDELPRTGALLPIVRGRIGQLGLELQIETREEWFSWRWGRFGVGYSYLRGYSGSLLRDSQSFTSRLQLFDSVALEVQLGLRNYTNRALVLDPPSYRSLELGHSFEIPSLR